MPSTSAARLVADAATAVLACSTRALSTSNRDMMDSSLAPRTPAVRAPGPGSPVPDERRAVAPTDPATVHRDRVPVGAQGPVEPGTTCA
ncbi:hypothetical protein GCM10027519_30130 [Kineococcus endophyticus]